MNRIRRLALVTASVAVTVTSSMPLVAQQKPASGPVAR